MGKRTRLLLIVFLSFLGVSAAIGSVYPIEYLGVSKQYDLNMSLEDQQPDEEVGKPHEIIQALPGKDASGNFRVFLGDALKDRHTGSTVDGEGKAIVPDGYVYSYHNTYDDAVAKRKIEEVLFLQPFDSSTAPLTRYLRVESVVDKDKVVISPITISIQPEQGAVLADRVTGRPDQYQCADSNGEAVFKLVNDVNQFYYGTAGTELYKLDGVNATRLTDVEIDRFVISKDQLIEARITLNGEEARRQFTLYVEKIRVSTVTPVLESIEVRADENTRYGSFNLHEAIPELIATGENLEYYTVVFYATESDAQNRKNALNGDNPIERGDGTKVYATVEYKLAKSCREVIKEISFKVIDKPAIPVLGDITHCDSSIETYSLSIASQTPIIADGRRIATEEEINDPNFDPLGKFSIDYFRSKEDAENNVNKLVGAEVTVSLNEALKIWTRLTDLENQNYNVASFYVSLGYNTLKTGEVPNGLVSYCQVESTTPNHQYTVDLSSSETVIKGIYNNSLLEDLNPKGAKLAVAYYENEADAIADNRMPASRVKAYPIQMGQKIDGIYARVIMEEGFGNCSKARNYIKYAISLSTAVSISSVPNEAQQQLCLDPITDEVIPVSLSVTNEDVRGRAVVVTWMSEVRDENNNPKLVELPNTGNQLSVLIESPGIYVARVSFETEPYPDAKSCDAFSLKWTVKAPPVAVVEGADATGMINSMEVDETGETMIRLGVLDGGSNTVTAGYEFAIDNSAFQPSSQFYNVPIGEHIAYARNQKTGCSTSVSFSVFGYPKYFTPNGDGYNDTWSIPGLKGHNEARIYIYDRSGRLLKQLGSQTEGWDGTWNGKPMPSTDYWFTVEFVNDFPGNKEKNGRKVSYKGHFSLKR